MTIASHQYIAINGVKDVVLAIGIISALAFNMKAKTQKFFVDFLLGGETGIVNIRLNNHGTNITISVLGKTYHLVCTIRKILIMSLHTLKERREIII